PEKAKQRFAGGDQERHGDGREGDAAFENGVEGEEGAARSAVGLPSAPPAAERESAHEHADDGAHRVGRIPDHGARGADPDDLVEESAESADEEESENQRAHRNGITPQDGRRTKEK